MYSLVKLPNNPVHLWLVTLRKSTNSSNCPFRGLELGEPILGDQQAWYSSDFRAVSFDRLSTVLRVGLDKEPTTEAFFAGHFEKAWEYGEFPKLMLVLDSERTRRSFREVPADSPEEELAELRAEFRTMLRSEDGTYFWFSQFPEGHSRLNSPYEVAHGRYIPGDPFEALRAAILFARPQDLERINILGG